ncbi:hypothetical protein ACFSX9_13590 [Flavobacterium ardleyense]|uniref:HTTM-like domain-containing protein n=1 Tax=Flavobacterium ardleyense TaxID=2038737 RepID=A0ABW5ZA50_9FLAO
MVLEKFNLVIAFKLSSIILSVGLVFDTLNFFLKKELYSDTVGLFQYDKLIHDKRKYFKNIYQRLPYLFSFKGYFALMIIRLICLLLLLLSFHWSLFLLLFIIQLIFNLRNIYSLSGADQMQNIILFGLLIISFNINSNIASLTVFFISVQMLLSYFFTGFHKIKSKKWRNGDALLLVLNSETFGNSTFQKLLYNNKFISIIISWVIILVQLSFIIVLFINPQLTVYFLTILFLFHLSIAFSMGLNHFFWVFVSSYPIIYYLSKNSLWNYLF